MSIPLLNKKRAVKVDDDEYKLLMYIRLNKVPLNIKAGSIAFHYNQEGRIGAYEFHVKPQEGQRIIIRRIMRTITLPPGLGLSQEKKLGNSSLENF